MTIEDCFNYLAPNAGNSVPVWPPDAFGLCAYILQKSGAYTTVVAGWPPLAPTAGVKWSKWMKEVGLKWRDLSVKIVPDVPPEINTWWAGLVAVRGTVLHDLLEPRNKSVCEALLQIMAAADEACNGIGMPGKSLDLFEEKVRDLFHRQTKQGEPNSTVCTELISAAKLCVLPKSHTPQSGMTIRSLTHNLALCSGGEVSLDWWHGLHSLGRELETDLNLLLVPWPTTVAPPHFSAVTQANCPLQDMPDQYGFFDYKIRGGKSWPGPQFDTLLKAAVGMVGRIDGVVLPELALRPDEVEGVWQQIKTVSRNSFLIAGVGAQSQPGNFGENRVTCILPLGNDQATELQQDKHHRWLLDNGQIKNYGLFKQLKADHLWWENTQLNPRRLKFISLTPWLTLCCLICEDLARQDPIADLIRSVGPNLVVALLMDGPQLKSRWPARYATVLADDPGCSVLTLTSIGMARLCKPFGTGESRIVALWKDSRRGPFEIEMPYDAAGIILCLHAEHVEQWTADGRSDEGAAASWVLNAIHPVSMGAF